MLFSRYDNNLSTPTAAANGSSSTAPCCANPSLGCAPAPASRVLHRVVSTNPRFWDEPRIASEDLTTLKSPQNIA